MFKRIEISYVSHIGKVRKNNEDNFYSNGKFMPPNNKGTEKIVHKPPFVLDHNGMNIYAVFDGMGGGDYGEIASFRCAEATKDFFSDSENINPYDITPTLQKLCSALNQRVFDEKQKLGVYQMGSTLVSVLFHGGRTWMCNLGDSKCYWYRADEETMYQMSDDHVEANGNGHKPMLTQYCGIDPDELTIEPSIECFEPDSGDIILLSSDGLTDMVSEEDILETLEEGDVIAIVKSLLSQALEAGGVDNTTIMVIKCL